MIWRRLMRMVRAEPTAAERLAEERAARERAATEASARWEASQAEAHRRWIEGAVAEMAWQAERARREGTDNVGFTNAGELPTVTVTEDQWVDMLGTRRGQRRFS
jgi:hypothetical protein